VTRPGADRIRVPAGTYALTIVGRGDDSAASGDLDVHDNVRVIGAGESATIIDADQVKMTPIRPR